MSCIIKNFIEAEDDAYCGRLYQNYLNDSDPEKDEVMSEDDVCKLLGVDL